MGVELAASRLFGSPGSFAKHVGEEIRELLRLLDEPGSKGTGSARDYATARFAGTPPARFRRGDANSDQDIDLSDAMFVLNYLFTGGNAPTCPKSADTDDSGALELTDPVYLLNHLFLG